jgi:hypothetical protein
MSDTYNIWSYSFIPKSQYVYVSVGLGVPHAVYNTRSKATQDPKARAKGQKPCMHVRASKAANTQSQHTTSESLPLSEQDTFKMGPALTTFSTSLVTCLERAHDKMGDGFPNSSSSADARVAQLLKSGGGCWPSGVRTPVLHREQ